jgi:predicted enzyme related to lactoylglutathione lyase
LIIDVRAIAGEKDGEDLRRFLADVMDYLFVDDEGYLIAALSPSELGIEPTPGKVGREFYIECDDLETTAKELLGKGVEFVRPVSETSFGFAASIRTPAGTEIGLCQRQERPGAKPSE